MRTDEEVELRRARRMAINALQDKLLDMALVAWRHIIIWVVEVVAWIGFVFLLAHSHAPWQVIAVWVAGGGAALCLEMKNHIAFAAYIRRERLNIQGLLQHPELRDE